MRVTDINFGIHDMKGETLEEKSINFFKNIAKHFDEKVEEYASLVNEETVNLKFSFEISAKHEEVPLIKIERKNYILK